jgi:hypothetical protein
MEGEKKREKKGFISGRLDVRRGFRFRERDDLRGSRNGDIYGEERAIRLWKVPMTLLSISSQAYNLFSPIERLLKDYSKTTQIHS